MENKFNVSVILPIKTATPKNFEDYFTKAITSLTDQTTKINELVIVHTDEELLTNLLNNFDFGDLTVKKLIWSESPNFAKQVNFGISQASSEWISILEFDDEYSKIWFKNVSEYSKIYKDVSAFLPIVIDVDEKGMFAGFTNEATFASNFSQEMGFLSNETLQEFQNFQTSGMVFSKSLIESFGGFKSNFKLTFVYEFLLRLTFNSVRVMTIPKIGYKHINLREGSIFWNHKYGTDILSENEVKFWIDSAKKEYFFKDERPLQYESQL
jgi:glycosyltransferase involved in cell wall biosynthesis